MTMKDKVRQAMGGAREKLGAATGNRRLKPPDACSAAAHRSAEVAHDLRSKARAA